MAWAFSDSIRGPQGLKGDPGDPAEVLGEIQYPGEGLLPLIPRVVTNDDATGLDGNIYGAGYRTPAAFGLSLGSRTTPTADASPVMWIQKYSSANRSVNPSEWDQGAGYFGMEKRAGDAYTAALTGFARHESVDGGDAVGVHARASAHKANSRIWGLWAYAYAADPSLVPVSAIGGEVNLNWRAPDQGHSPTTGFSKLLLLVTQDGSLPITMGLEVGRGTNAPAGYIHTGVKTRRDSIMAAGGNTSSGLAPNEAYLLEGATSAVNGAHGIRFGYGNFRTGISFAESTFSENAAILFGEGHRLAVGPGAGVSTYAEFSRTNNYMNLMNLLLRINGTQVVGNRRTGWTAPTGTASRSAFAVSTVTLAELAAIVKAIIDDLTTHGLIGP